MASKALIYIYKQGCTMEVGEPVLLGTGTGPIHPWLVLFFKQHFESLPGTGEYDLERREVHFSARLATEYNCAGQIFCANPNYRNGGPWYNWAMFRWTKEGTRSKNCSTEDSCMHYGDNEVMKDQYTYAPGLILGFLNPQDPQVIVLCCDSSYSKSLVFSTHWKVLYTDKAMKNPMICLVSPDAIVRHCLMIPESDDWNGFHKLWARERWEMNFVLFKTNVSI